MADEHARDEALRPLAPGTLLELRSEALTVQVAPEAGGRIAQICCDGMRWLCGPDEDDAAIAWGCYPMLPWAGRIRGGRFHFDGREYRLPANLAAHAIHGVGFTLPWEVSGQSAAQLELSLQLPRDARWPFGGSASQRITLARRALRLELSLTAGDQAMPRPVLGWHPWFRKPERLDFHPSGHFPRDGEGIATRPPAPPPPHPWDDCFINNRPVRLYRAGQGLCLTSGCDHWVVFDERLHTTCVEPQTGPPDAFNLDAGQRLAPGESMTAWFMLEQVASAHALP
ncbi:MAG TPA: hypothetical protein VMH77_09230 [Steroidobacteraceae bacterium]|nr:hypothetical protein [Steroidobacteraceae bacterium]